MSRILFPEYLQKLSSLWTDGVYGDHTSNFLSHKGVARLYWLFDRIYTEIESFGYCVALLDFCHQESQNLYKQYENINSVENPGYLSSQIHEKKFVYQNWRYIAVREAAADFRQIWSLYKKGVVKMLETTDAVKHMKNPNIASQIVERFNRELNWEESNDLRNASQHRAEKLIDDILNLNNPTEQIFSKGYRHEDIEGNTYITTQRGETVKLEVSREKYIKLHNFYKDVLDDMAIDGVRGPTPLQGIS